MADGNFIIYFVDGTITSSDNRKKLWYTTNSKGIKRVRNLQTGTILDTPHKPQTITKTDPETNAILKIRSDGVLLVHYTDQSLLTTFPDGT